MIEIEGMPKTRRILGKEPRFKMDPFGGGKTITGIDAFLIEVKRVWGDGTAIKVADITSMGSDCDEFLVIGATLNAVEKDPKYELDANNVVQLLDVMQNSLDALRQIYLQLLLDRDEKKEQP